MRDLEEKLLVCDFVKQAWPGVVIAQEEQGKSYGGEWTSPWTHLNLLHLHLSCMKATNFPTLHDLWNGIWSHTLVEMCLFDVQAICLFSFLIDLSDGLTSCSLPSFIYRLLHQLCCSRVFPKILQRFSVRVGNPLSMSYLLLHHSPLTLIPRTHPWILSLSGTFWLCKWKSYAYTTSNIAQHPETWFTLCCTWAEGLQLYRTQGEWFPAPEHKVRGSASHSLSGPPLCHCNSTPITLPEPWEPCAIAFFPFQPIITSFYSVMAKSSNCSFADIPGCLEPLAIRAWVITALIAGRLGIRIERMVLLPGHATVAFPAGTDKELSGFHYRCSRREGNKRENGKKNFSFCMLEYQP